MLYELLIASIILSMATAIQSVVGFGLAMFAVPLLMLSGVDLLTSVFLVLSISLVSASLGVFRLRSEIQWKKAALASVLRGIGVLPGYAAAVYTSESSPATIKAAIGFAIGLGVFAQFRKLNKGEQDDRPLEPSSRVAPLAFLASGFLMGWLGMGGPPLIFWLLTGRQDAKVSRSFLYGVYLFTIPFQLTLMLHQDPALLHSVVPTLSMAIPVCLVVTAVTLRIGDRLDVAKLQRWSLALLTLLAAKALFDWVQHLLQA